MLEKQTITSQCYTRTAKRGRRGKRNEEKKKDEKRRRKRQQKKKNKTEVRNEKKERKLNDWRYHGSERKWKFDMRIEVRFS